MVKIYQMTTKYTKWPENIPNGHKIYQHFPLQDPPNLPTLDFFGLKINHLATLLRRGNNFSLRQQKMVEKRGSFRRQKSGESFEFTTTFRHYLGSMLRSQFSASFCQFSAEKIGVFLKNQCYDEIFALFSFVFR
jgi:hypothetical protein